MVAERGVKVCYFGFFSRSSSLSDGVSDEMGVRTHGPDCSTAMLGLVCRIQTRR